MADEAESVEDGISVTWENTEASAIDGEELPDSVAETRVVLLPVNPHLVHIYWELSAHDWEEVSSIFSRHGPRTHPVLRFYASPREHFDTSNASSWFEVEIALAGGSWYVRLENAARFYRLDLGLRTAGGGFSRLAQSNVAETLRDGASDTADEHYPLVEAQRPRAVPAQQEQWGLAPNALPVGQPPRGEERRQPPGEAQRNAPPLSATHEEGRGAARSAPSYAPPWENRESGPQHEEVSLFGSPPEESQPSLAEFYRQRGWEPPAVVPPAGAMGGFQPSGRGRADLTELSEVSFRAGAALGRKSS